MSDEPEEESSEPAKKTKKRKVGKYNKANPMPPEVKEQIHTRHAEGASYAELAKECEVALSTIAKVLKAKPDSLTTKNKSANSYVCVDGHQFLSKLPPGEVMCPICHTTDCNLGTRNGAVEESVE